MPMTDYLDFSDLKAFLIGLLGSATWYLLYRAWSNHSVKSIARRIKESEAEKIKLDNLAKSDRALIIHGFQAVFAILALLFIILGFHPILATKELHDLLNGREILQLGIWLIASLLCIGVVMTFQQIADYPKSMEKSMRRSQSCARRFPRSASSSQWH
jgi:uncharacterized membrane protein YbhN (UPF0104 family)